MSETAVLIVNWNTPDDLENCLATLRYHEEEIDTYVCQNFFDKPTADRVLRLCRDYSASFFQRLDNPGHGTGINALARATKSWHDYFFIINPDVKWTEPVIDRLVDFLKDDPRRFAVGPKQLDTSGRITAGGIFGTLDQPQHRDFRVYDPANLQYRDIVRATVVAGSALMVSRDDFFEYGPMLEAKHYYSETWMCYHAIAHGRTNWYYGEASMIHEWHRSTPMGDPNTDGKFKEDRELFRAMCDAHDPPIPHD